MAKNIGKRFEEDFKKSVPTSSLLIRLQDPPQSFAKSENTKFSHKNPCDFLLFDCEHRVFVPIELKTTKNKSISFDDINIEDKQNGMIHKHQIIGLTGFSKYDNVVAGFLFNFRDEKSGLERCYFQNVKDFNAMVQKINKKSFNELDLLTDGNAIKLNGNVKRSRYHWDIDSLLNDITIKYIH